MIKKCFSNKSFLISVLLLTPIILIALLGPWIVSQDPLLVDHTIVLRRSMPGYPLGTDEFGRDILSRLVLGLRPTMIISIGASLFAMFNGLLFGMIAGYFGKAPRHIIMRLSDMILCFPSMLLGLLVVVFWGSSVSSLLIIIAIIFTPQFIRLTYASTIKVKQLEFIESDIALGASPFRIIVGGILPNIISPIIIQFSLTLSAAILMESSLSFLGVGVLPPTPSWGQMIGTARGYLHSHPSYLLWPALCLCVTILAVNLLGDSLRDILDPKLHIME